jgi:hypothetical protein
MCESKLKKRKGKMLKGKKKKGHTTRNFVHSNPTHFVTLSKSTIFLTIDATILRGTIVKMTCSKKKN